MKKFRLLAAMVITVAMLFTVALAAEIVIDAPKYNGEATYTVTVKTTKDLEIGGFSTLALGYNADVFEFVSATSDDTAATWGEEDGAYVYYAGQSDTTLAAGKAVMTVTFNVNGNAVGQVFDITDAGDNDLTCFCAGATNGFEEYEVVGMSATVEAAAQAAAPTYTGTVNPKATLNGVDDVYTGVWAANYTVALNGNAITKVGLRFADKADDAFAVAKTADGEGSVAFKIAIVGAPADAVATPIVYTTEWIAAEAE